MQQIHCIISIAALHLTKDLQQGAPLNRLTLNNRTTLGPQDTSSNHISQKNKP
jgi:hypothetical protein